MSILTTATRAAGYAGYEVSSISLTGSAGAPLAKTSDRHSSPFDRNSSSCMDPHRHAQGASSQDLRSQQSRTSLDSRLSIEDTRPQVQSSPLPQTQWTNVPLSYRPRDLPDLADQPLPRPPITGHALSGSATRDSRRRLQALQESAQARTVEEHSANTALLYPGMSPYADRLPVSAPAEGHHISRSVSQPASPSYFQQRFQESEPPFMHIPRTPTYPPAGRRRMHSASGVTDAAFADEEEFRLFVDATAGLGPEQAFRHPSSPSRPYDNGRSSNRYSAPGRAVSPDEQTPTTMRALQQLASMPQASPQPPRQRLQTSAGGLDLWIQPPSRPRSASSIDFGEVEELPPDDELPDYAQSQAQALRHQRAEAARRAQELQRRWNESGSRRG
ncbi:hypothetical protein LTR53_017631, partial [Teratosphaeriaceae sp. CCFEE 6253]